MTTHKHLPQPSLFSAKAYTGVISLLVLGGLFTSVYLANSHYRNFTDIGYQSFCAISRSLNCDTVSQSPYAVFAGAPLAIWGGIGYLLFLWLILLFRADKSGSRGWSAAAVTAGLYCAVSVWLAIISSTKVRSYCLMCIATYAVNFMLLFFAWLASRRFGAKAFWANLRADLRFLAANAGRVVLTCAAAAVLMGATALFYPNYWRFPALSTASDLPTGVTEEGYPWIGAEKPELTIVEFADYMCFQCGKMHSHLRQLVNQYPDRIRLVHRHYPLDSRVNPVAKDDVHPNAGMLSLFAIVAQQAGKFWPVNDALFREARAKKTINFAEIGRESGLEITDFREMINDRKVITHLEKDIRAGLKLGITATPSYVVDGKLYIGAIPEEILSRVINAEPKGADPKGVE